jgi:hypothetical protein
MFLFPKSKYCTQVGLVLLGSDCTLLTFSHRDQGMLCVEGKLMTTEELSSKAELLQSFLCNKYLILKIAMAIETLS